MKKEYEKPRFELVCFESVDELMAGKDDYSAGSAIGED